MSTKHTKGKWRLVHVVEHPTESNMQIGFIQTDKTCFDFSAIESDTMPRSEFEANSKLVSAAPDLLEACQQVIYLIEKEGNLLNLDAHIVREAITKATGVK